MGLGGVRPQLVGAVDPDGLHAAVQRGQHIERGIVADMQHLMGLDARRQRRGLKNAPVRLADAEHPGADAGREIRSDADAVEIGVAVGQRHQRQAAGQERQRIQRIAEQRHLVARGEKNVERGLCKQRIVAAAHQRRADRRQPKRAQVVPEFGVGLVDLLADFMPRRGLGQQRGRRWRMLGQPVVERFFSPLDGRPDRPQRVVQVQGHGFDKGQVKHGKWGVKREYRMSFAPEPSFAHGAAPKAASTTAILLCNLGTPDAPTAPALRRYLGEFLSDARVVEIPKALWWLILHGVILRTRPKKSAAKYASVWGPEGSPLKVWTQKQAVMLRGYLGQRGHPVEVRYAMRYGNPSIASQLDQLKADGVTRILILPAYPQYSGTTTASVFDAVYSWAARVRRIPEFRFINHYHDDSGYIAALADSIRRHWQLGGQAELLVMSFHGVPERTLMLGDPYHCECQKTARLLAEQLGLPMDRYRVTFQSRFGKAKWLEPYTEPTLIKLAQSGVKSVDVVCPGFTSDCLETLEEISMEARHAFIQAGGKAFNYIECLNDSPQWLAALSDLGIRHMGGWNTTAPEADQTLADSRTRAKALGAAQ
ncbi:MAG: Ferrochelatase [Polaromonas sp.]|nr:Ferrochelatase [Polaromonas sp.]